jgi:hypothetical protein
MVQALNTSAIQVYGGSNINVWTSPITAPAPAAWPAQPGSAYLPVGWLDLDAGITESVSRDETEKYGLQGASLIRTLRSKEKRSLAFTALEENSVTAGLLNPFGTTTTVAGTAEIQTVTITGTPTGGTFDLILNGYGAALGNAYNITASALQAALRSATGLATLTVGLTGSVYTVTFDAASGNLPQLSYANGLTGGTSPGVTVATTTPGANPVNTTLVKPATSLNQRYFVVDLESGSGIYHRRWYKNAEAIQAGDVALATGDDFSVYAFTMNAYLDNSGAFYVDVNNNPLLAAGLYV